MKQLKELVTIDKRFRKSVNLQLDLGDYEKVIEYIPTRSSVAILKRYLRNVQGKTSENANILIGPYGKGKSHLILVLLAVLKGRSGQLMPLFHKLEKIDTEATTIIASIWNNERPFLPVLVSGSGRDLNASFLQALGIALEREGLSELTPDSYYSEAEKNIKVWKKEYPDTYVRFQELLKKKGYCIADFMKSLRQQEEESLRLFLDIYPQLTAGSVFQPVLRQEALSIYREVNRKLCEQYGYSGIYIVFDEFSKYIEGHEEENFSADMKVLQDMCELANGGEEKLFLTLIAHKSIHEYGRNIPRSVKNAFQGVEGRLREIRFVVSAQNNYELIADTILKREPDFTAEYDRRMQEEDFCNVIEESYQLPCFQSLFEKEDYEQIMARGCFPLTPLCAYALLHLSEKIAQNERTIFTFLSGNEPGSLLWLLKKGATDMVGIPAVYDYFKSLFREIADMPQIHNEWLKADYALDMAKSDGERKVIKALAVIRMIHKEDEFPAQNDVIRLSVGMKKEDYETAITGLTERGIVLYRSSQGMYAFKNNVGVDVEVEIKKEMASLSGRFQLCEKLSEVSELEYVIPRKYNQKHAMTRYFRYEYMTPEAFLKLEKGDYLFEHGFSDGKIIGLVSEMPIDKSAIAEHVRALHEARMVVIVPHAPFSQVENIKRLEAVRSLMQNEAFLEENKVLLQELKLYEEDLIFEINAALEENFMPEHGKTCVLHLGDSRSRFTAAGMNAYLSDILESYYEHTPRVNHELLNIQNVTGQYLRARNQVVNTILKSEDCSRFLQGTSPEAMVYRAAFVRTGLVSGDYPTDPGCEKMMEQMEDFFRQCVGKRQPFSVLYENLQGRHYGVRRGILPLFIAMKLSMAEETAIIYLGSRELEIDAEVLNRVNDFPEKYQLYIEPESAGKEQYLKALEAIFCESSGQIYTKQKRLGRIMESMQKWYRSLPQYAMVTMRFPQDKAEEIRVLRNCLKKVEINPRELLLERLPEVINRKDIRTEHTGEKDILPECMVQTNTGRQDLQNTAERIGELRTALEHAMDDLRLRMAAVIRTVFGAREKESLKGCLKEWYRRYEKAAETSILGISAENLMRFLKGLTTNDEAEIVSELSRKLLDMYLEDWNDEMEQQFGEILQQAKEEVESISGEETGDNELCQIILKDASGNKIEKFYEAGEENSTAAYLKNVIEEALEDFGDSLETNQKVAVLISAITELLQ